MREGCRATFSNLLVPLFACWWLSLVLLGAGASGLCVPVAGSVGSWLFSFPFQGRRPEDRHFGRYPGLCSGTLVPCISSHASAGLLVVHFVTDQMVGDRRFPGATILGASFPTCSANHPMSVPPTGPELRDAWWTLYNMSGPVRSDGFSFLGAMCLYGAAASLSPAVAATAALCVSTLRCPMLTVAAAGILSSRTIAS